jgi:glyoxylase-like metal-dependent hydrolase (beta-lactamase superfamily II)
MVINSHLHFDHAGTNTKRLPDGRLAATFPRATYVIRRGEWEYASHPNERSRASYLAENWQPLKNTGQVELIGEDQEVMHGVSVFLTTGHLKHHQSVRVESEGKIAVFLADVIPTPHHLRLPWIMSYDLYPVDTLETKRRLLRQALDENWLLIFYHDPDVPMGYVREVNNRIMVEPLNVKRET